MKIPDFEIKSVLERITDGIVALDNEWNYTYLNPQAAVMLNRQRPADLIGRNYWQEFPEAKGTPFAEAYLRAMQEQVTIVFEDYYAPWDRWFENRIYPSKEGLSIFFTEITERKRAEADLKKSQALYHDLVETSQDLVWQCDAEDRYIYLNPAWEQTFGYTIEEMLDKRFSDFQSQEYAERDLQEFAQLMQGNMVKGYETVHLGKDGRRIHLVFNAKFLRDESSNITGTRGTAYDITARIQSERELRRVNRALRLLSECNQALIRATSEEELLQAICRNAVEVGGYRLAWVGIAENDKAQSVRLVAQAGFEEGYLESLNITWADAERGRGPTGTAIRSGRPVIARNIPGDPAFAPWREAAVQRGYASSIALPIILPHPPPRPDGHPSPLSQDWERGEGPGVGGKGGEVWGALNIYAAEADAFDDEEVKLLSELASDLAYGLHALRNRQALRESEARYRQLFDASPDALFILGSDGRFLDCNQVAEQRYGYSRQEFAQMTPGDLDAPGLQEQVASRLKQALDRGSTFELRHRRKDGSEIPVEISATPITLAGQRCILASVRDIIERKRAEEALRDSEARLKMSLEAANAGVWQWEVSSNRAIWSDENYQVLGLTPGSVAPSFDNWLACVHPDDREHIRAQVAQVIEQQAKLDIEFRVVWPDGSIRWINDRGQMSFDQNGRPVRMTGIQIDITDQKRAQETLQRQLSELIVLQLIGQAGTQAATTDELIEQVTQTIGETLYPDNFGVLLLDESAGVLRPHPSYRGVPEEQKHITIPLEKGIVGLVVRRGIPHRSDDAHRDPAYFQVNLETRSEVCVPIQVNDRVLGVINTESTAPGFFTVADERLLTTIAGKVALERRPVIVADLRATEKPFMHPEWTAGENFVFYFAIPLIAKGEVKGVLEIFHRALFTPDQDWINFLETLAGQAAIAIDNAELFENLQRSNLDLSLAYETTLEGWSRALDLREHETERHSDRVTETTLTLARAMKVSKTALGHIRRGALLHDIGKMGIPDGILLKPGPLTDEEWDIMRQHPQYAYDLLSAIAYLRPALDIPYCHHEKWDGSGYPRQLTGEQIPLPARLFAVVDVYDALTSDRPYRPAWSKAEAVQYIQNQAGKHFDPAVVEAFLKLIQQ